MSVRWKVKKLRDGRWFFSAPGCPDRPHFCWRWLSLRGSCGAKPTLAEAYAAAWEGARNDALDDYVHATQARMAGLAVNVKVGDRVHQITDPSQPLRLWGQDRA